MTNSSSGTAELSPSDPRAKDSFPPQDHHDKTTLLNEWSKLRALHARSLLCWLATSDEALGANVSPKEIFSFALPGTLLIGEIASSCSLKNIAYDPRVCVSFIDLRRQNGGYKLHGTAEILAPDHPKFARHLAELLPFAGELRIMRHIIAIDVTQVAKIAAPAHLQAG